MEQNGHSREFRLRYSEVDDRGELTPVSLLNILEETASSHCDESGWGVFRLMEEGYGWVLLRGGFEMSRYPRYREDFRVETWVSRARRFEAYRENRVVSSTGEILGTARALWLFYDISRRRPASIFEDILKAWTPGGPAASGMDLSEIEGPSSAPDAESRAAEADFAVRRADIDTNGHVNNVVYLSWALEALPKATREGAYLSSLRGQFKRELKLGASAMPLCADEGEGKFRLGVIANSSSRAEPYMAAAAESLWRPRLSA